MITIIYDPLNGYAVPDARAEDFVRCLKDGQSITVSTENVIQFARALVVEEGLEVKFMFNGKIVEHNEYAAINDWPKGFCDYTHFWTSRILTEAVKKRKRKQDEPVNSNK
ncbi:hypothetical protein LCGC14_1953120 [marine sediment metagenome]|uniref:Uncharacterized protein n=1 Tax=marine sediment metagenome TaxID=412755 RepID=A0A0F9HV75_9ZZZZ